MVGSEGMREVVLGCAERTQGDALAIALAHDLHCQVTSARTGAEIVTAIATGRPSLAVFDFRLPDASGLDVAQTVLMHKVPVLFVAPPRDVAALQGAGWPCIAEPIRIEELLSQARALVGATRETLAALEASMHLLRATRAQLIDTMERSRELAKLLRRERIARLKRTGMTPARARRPSLLEDWDIMRAAEHMRDTHGRRAVETADHRAAIAGDVQTMRRWRAIAAAIRQLDGAARG